VNDGRDPLCIRAWLHRLLKNSALRRFASGHDFSRAEKLPFLAIASGLQSASDQRFRLFQQPLQPCHWPANEIGFSRCTVSMTPGLKPSALRLHSAQLGLWAASRLGNRFLPDHPGLAPGAQTAVAAARLASSEVHHIQIHRQLLRAWAGRGQQALAPVALDAGSHVELRFIDFAGELKSIDHVRNALRA